MHVLLFANVRLCLNGLERVLCGAQVLEQLLALRVTAFGSLQRHGLTRLELLQLAGELSELFYILLTAGLQVG